MTTQRQARRPGRNDPCPCGSGLKFKKCHGVSVPLERPSKSTKPAEPPRAWLPFRKLKETEAQRRAEIEEIFSDEFAFIDDCLGLAARQVEILGDLSPTTVEDVAMRDVSCDAFEFLYEARQAIAENRPSVVFPAMRRAFESICLSHLFTVKPEFGGAWSSGQKLSSGEVRKQLEGTPLTESVEQLREEYRHFSQGTHPNRSHIPYVFLGEGNRFTLGAIPPIDPLNLGGHIRHLISLCYWYVGVFLYFFREVVTPRVDEQFKSSFLDLTPRMKRLKVTLDEQLNELRKHATKEPVPESVGTAFLQSKSGRPSEA